MDYIIPMVLIGLAWLLVIPGYRQWKSEEITFTQLEKETKDNE